MIKISNILSRKNRNLLAEMVRTDFKLRYQNSILGYLWSLLKPLLLFGILYVVFTKFLRFGEGIPNYAVSLLLGIVLWNFFLEATTTGVMAIVGRGDLLRKIHFPKYLLVLSSTSSALINLFLNLIVVVIFAIFNGVPFSFSIFLFPLLLLELLIFTLAASFFLAAAYVRFRDIGYIWEVALQGLFYAIPIIYPLVIVPSEMAQKFILLNPIAQIIQDARAVVVNNNPLQIYEALSFFWFVPFVIVGVTIVIATLYFKKESTYFAENI